MIESTQKAQVVEEILNSPEFKDSKRYRELLQYLVDETLAGRSPKEITVGMQFFGKNASFDPKEDPIVRVYLNNLRKKLEHYYLTSANPFTVRLSIPKGHYQVEFTEITEEERRGRPNRIVWIAGAFAAAVVIFFLGFGSHLLVSRPGERKWIPSPVWNDFVSPGGRPTMIVLGDFFFLYERAPSGKIGNFIRDVKINTPEDLRNIIKQDPLFAKRFVQSDFTFLRPSASWGLAQILPILNHAPNGYSLKLASQFTVDDLKSHNVVFIGSFKTLFGLQKYLHTFGIEYSITPASFRIFGDGGEPPRRFAPVELKGGNYEKDFAVVAEGTGPEGSTMLLLLGFADTGVIEATRAVSDSSMLERIHEKVGSGPAHFTMVIETEGINQSIFKSEIRHVVRRGTSGGSTPPIGTPDSIRAR